MAASCQHGGHERAVFGLGAHALLAIGLSGAGGVVATGHGSLEVRMAGVHAAVDDGNLYSGALGNLPCLGDAGLGQPVLLIAPFVRLGRGGCEKTVDEAAACQDQREQGCAGPSKLWPHP
jgi:hypothetical protein